MRASSYIVFVPLPNEDMTLLFHGYSGAVDLVSSHVASVLAEPGAGSARLEASLSAETLNHLATRGYVTEKTREDEKRYVIELGTRVHGIMKKYSPPGFLVVPTYSCNLRCTYCYEKGLRKKGTSWLEKHLSEDMIEAALDAMDRINEPRHLQKSLTLYGGEPLQRSNAAMIRLLHERACSRGFRRFSAITNAVDLDHFADILGNDGGISFLQITIDGPPVVHDARRFLRNREGTFDRIIRNIELAMQRGVKISVRVNVDRTNADRVEWLKAFFREKGWAQNPQFRAYCSPVHGGIRAKPGSDSFTSHLEMCRAVQGNEKGQHLQEDPSSFQTDAMTHAVLKRILAHLAQEQDLPPWRTAFCGSNMAMYLFDPFGDIYPCWEVIGHPEHRIGIYGPGFVDLDPEAVGRWHHRSVVKIRTCQSCAYLFFCGGGCEAFAYRATGSLDQPHCFSFPVHFQKAAVMAYRQWTQDNQDRPPLPRS
jgi:uncharacterized protein